MMQNTTKEMMENLTESGGLSRQQLEANVQISHNWATAVRSGTFAGAQAIHIATLLEHLRTLNEQALKAYEAASLQHPEWGRKDSPEKEPGAVPA